MGPINRQSCAAAFGWSGARQLEHRDTTETRRNSLAPTGGSRIELLVRGRLILSAGVCSRRQKAAAGSTGGNRGFAYARTIRRIRTSEFSNCRRSPQRHTGRIQHHTRRVSTTLPKKGGNRLGGGRFNLV